jgi:hypothetical protein
MGLGEVINWSIFIFMSILQKLSKHRNGLWGQLNEDFQFIGLQRNVIDKI